MLMNAIEEVADKFDNAAVVDFSDVADNVENECQNALQEFSDGVHYGKHQEDEDDARDGVKAAARDICEGARSALAQSFSSEDIKAEVCDMLNQAGQVFYKAMIDNKDLFIKEIEEKFKERLDSLKKDLQNKEENIKQAEAALKSLQSFRAKI